MESGDQGLEHAGESFRSILQKPRKALAMHREFPQDSGCRRIRRENRCGSVSGATESTVWRVRQAREREVQVARSHPMDYKLTDMSFTTNAVDAGMGGEGLLKAQNFQPVGPTILY